MRGRMYWVLHQFAIRTCISFPDRLLLLPVKSLCVQVLEAWQVVLCFDGC